MHCVGQERERLIVGTCIGYDQIKGRPCCEVEKRNEWAGPMIDLQVLDYLLGCLQIGNEVP